MRLWSEGNPPAVSVSVAGDPVGRPYNKKNVRPLRKKGSNRSPFYLTRSARAEMSSRLPLSSARALERAHRAQPAAATARLAITPTRWAR